MNPNALGRLEPANLGQCFIALNPAFFPAGYSQRLRKLTDQLRDLPVAVDAPGPVLVPGDNERIRTEEQLEGGIRSSRTLLWPWIAWQVSWARSGWVGGERPTAALRGREPLWPIKVSYQKVAYVYAAGCLLAEPTSCSSGIYYDLLEQYSSSRSMIHLLQLQHK